MFECYHNLHPILGSSNYLLPGATEGNLANGCRRRLRQICDMPAATLIDLAEIHTGRGREGYGLRRKAGKEGRGTRSEMVVWGKEENNNFLRSIIKLLPALLIALVFILCCLRK